ncbi:sensor histidine kinase [Lederbergia lenta]|uniref:histidine kinase n=1 Tax=Lederbergia lenta TaxID=1467 RepID=A0A2X4W1V1_LEDLE|nr:sensor histidine kinase [Lederbergia lenta]MEC2323708.1 sensor histidine kinase [Lederbergia lenta]SQI51590.1 sensor histidine kinase [Lederbergia lenta]
MKLFLREHIPLISINIVQVLIILFTFWLGGYRNYPLVLYSLFLGAFLLTVYLTYRYITHKAFYKRLTSSIEGLDEANQSLGYAPLPEALERLLKSQYTQYMNELNVQAKKRSDHLTFINQWVHQMKTPLSVIELLAQEDDDEKIESIREEADRLGKGLEMVLYAARLEAFEHDFQVGPVSLGKITEQTIRDNKRLFIKSRVYPETNIDPEIVVESDEKWLSFILNQFITNAVKYSSGISQKIMITVSKAEDHALIEIQDHGIGIAKTDMKRIFHPFFTGENGRLYRESTGMGLYLAKEVCDLLGHEIEMESEKDKGTKVKLII